MMESKFRVFIALYLQQDIKEEDQEDAGLSLYHWAIWIEPKGAKDTTPSHCFDAVADDFTGGWQFQYDDSAQAIRSPGLVLRVMIGKLPQRARIDPDIFQLLHEVPLPNASSDYLENSVSWIAEALLVLQEHGMVEPFDIPEIMQQSASVASKVQNGHFIGGKKINAVGNRKFP